MVGAAVAALALGAAGQVPIWFCVACPAVLGLLAPFFFNFALGELADAACVRFNLPQDACTELWCAFLPALFPALALSPRARGHVCDRVGGERERERGVERGAVRTCALLNLAS